MKLKKFRIVESYKSWFTVQSWTFLWPFWMDAWEECRYQSLEEAEKELADYKAQLAFRRRIVG